MSAVDIELSASPTKIQISLTSPPVGFAVELPNGIEPTAYLTVLASRVSADFEAVLAGDLITQHPTISLINNINALNIGDDMTINASAPLTLGWAIGLTVSLIVAAIAIAGGTFSLLHSDINDVRSEISSVRDGASGDNQALREDMRQDFSQLNVKLDKMSSVMTDIRVAQASKDK